MVRLRDELPRLANGEPDFDLWLDEIRDIDDPGRRSAHRLLAMISGDSRVRGIELVELLVGLQVDLVTVMAGLSFYALSRGEIGHDEVDNQVSRLVVAVARLSSIDVLPFAETSILRSESKSQAENVRAMLVALIDDPRVAVIKLADVVVALRAAKDNDSPLRQRAAREGLEFFAPLAGRLGIWQLKWAIEDLAFRYLYKDAYMRIASMLDGRRDERERQVEAIRQDLAFRLDNVGINAELSGRAKAIYSIWQKMQSKSIDFAEVHDVQAVRVLVDSIEDCYRVLGIVHTSWPHIPDEFDDYIANPKENGYRSIHTAVIGPVGKTLEVQIRTREMHDEAELGVCAHWAYKGDEGLESKKLDWLRNVLDWHDELGAQPIGSFDSHDRVFVATPQGHVVDLSDGATPIDFAFRIHTDVGYRCRGARIDGTRVPLNTVLRTGQRVEIETADEGGPPREWLNPALGYIATSRARSKIQGWFRGQLSESNVSAGRTLLTETFERLGIVADIDALAREAGYDSEDELLLAVGVGEQHVIHLVRLASTQAEEQLSLLPHGREERPGFFTSFRVICNDRDDLIRDIMAALSESSTSIVGVNARATEPGVTASISIDLHAESMTAFATAIERIERINDVRRVERVVEGTN